MDEMQIIGGDDLSTLAGKVCSCGSALCPLRPGCCREISNLHFRSALQSISDTLLGLLIHANECVDPFNDSSFYKTLLLSCFQGLTQTKSFVSKLPSNLISDNLTLQNPLSTPPSLSHFFFSYSHFQVPREREFFSFICLVFTLHLLGTKVRHLNMFVEVFKI